MLTNFYIPRHRGFTIRAHKVKITYYPDSTEIKELQNDTTNFISYRGFNWSLLCS